VPSHPVVILGAGWSGLAAAATLSQAGIACQVLESAPQPGGRARNATLSIGRVDNGQHILIGAYTGTLALLEALGAPEASLFRRYRLELKLTDLCGGEVCLRTPNLPAPLHLAAAIATASGLSARERVAALGFGLWLMLRRFDIDDQPLGALLSQRNQPPKLTRALWEPLCLATLNTPVAQASARLFAAVLQRAFTGQRKYADLLMPRDTLGELLPRHAVPAIESAGGALRTGCRVQALQHDGDRITGVQLADGTTIDCREVIIATGPRAAHRLMAPTPPLQPVAAMLENLESQPIDTVYLQYDPATRLPGPMHGVLGGLSQWIIDRRDCGQPGLMASVLSAEGPHTRLNREQLGDAVADEMARLFPAWPAPREVVVVREKRATFAATAGVEAHRPESRTAMTGCWLAGDWTATGLPATIEGAVQSGLQSAQGILDARTATR